MTQTAPTANASDHPSRTDRTFPGSHRELHRLFGP